jgi:predicted AAA+ superfamily ATPase
MFNRKILSDLAAWADEVDRRPLILRGARQVGKTTVVELFGKTFDHFLSFNLEIESERRIFETNNEPSDLLGAMLFSRGVPKNDGRTLIFIDEIQNSPTAVAQLRYLYELFPEYYIIAAGSLLEPLIGRHISFPVGRVDFRVVHPVSFVEFLDANREKMALEAINSMPFPEYAHDRMNALFRTYTFIGGMPKIVQQYCDTSDLVRLKPIYDSLIASYLDDVEKYAPNDQFSRILRFLIRQSFYFAGSRITFQGFGKSAYSSREVGDAFRLLEKTMLLRLVYPSVETRPPLIPDIRKSPRLHLLDTGLVNFAAGLQNNLFGNHRLDETYEGKIIEHVVGQELLARQSGILGGLNFWVREKRQAQSEIDFLYNYKGQVVPIEVKSGAAGHLRSLHQFIAASEADLAVRVYTGKFSIEPQTTVAGKKFRLLNLPCYLVSKIDEYLDML